MPQEIELKLRIAESDIPRLKRLPVLKSLLQEKPRSRRLVSTYYDTPELALLDRKMTLRVRRMSGGWFQAVKGGGGSLAGLHQRDEWEDIIATGRPDFTKIANIPDPAVAGIFAPQEFRAALKPVFTTDMQRTEWQLAYPDGTHIELALDVGRLVIDGQAREAICEIELELKNGRPARLFDLALEIQDALPIHLENVSKAQRGYAYYRPTPPAVVKAGATKLNPGAKAVDAFRQIAWECLSQLQGNLDMVLQGNDIEGVHQMRVALRRLRSLISVFGAVVDRTSCEALVEEVRWINDLLGAARNLDVFVTETLPPMLEPLHQHKGLQLLGEKARQAQGAAYACLREALQSQRYQRLQLALGAWLEGGAWVKPNSNTLSIITLAAKVLGKRYKQLRQHGRRLVHMHPEERHQTRISAKKSRYAAEFFTSLYPGNGTKGFIRALADLQGVLGILNDIATTEGVIRDLIGAHPGRALDEVLHLFSGWNACNAMYNLEHMREKWDRLEAQEPFWK